MIVYVHVGTHKTGSTAIQVFLWEHRELLESRGLYIPRAGAVGQPPEIAHHNIPLRLEGRRNDPKAGGLDELVAELRARDPERACISSEIFAPLYSKPALLRELRAKLESIGADVRIVVYYRPQASYLEALYAELVKHGLTDPFEDFLERAIADGEITFNHATYGFEYDRMTDAFADAFGRDAISIVPYSDSPRAEEAIERFLEIVAPDAADLDLTQLGAWERRNLSIGFRGVAEKLVANREGDHAIDDVLEELIPDESVEAEGRFRPLGVGDLARLLTRFGPNNRALRQRYGADVPVWFAKRLIDQVRKRRLS